MFSFDQKLYYLIVKYPEELLALLHLQIRAMFQEMYPDTSIAFAFFMLLSWRWKAVDATKIQVRVFNLKTTKPMRDLNPSGTIFLSILS